MVVDLLEASCLRKMISNEFAFTHIFGCCKVSHDVVEVMALKTLRNNTIELI